MTTITRTDARKVHKFFDALKSHQWFRDGMTVINLADYRDLANLEEIIGTKCPDSFFRFSVPEGETSRYSWRLHSVDQLRNLKVYVKGAK